ncbi:MAG: hypothetical protein MUF07_04855 [Steroidobacteraceae bacterium]|jgi:hypothetical protein|nr:hypothetical protein [Steroidobacteraceae bacterium]
MRHFVLLVLAAFAADAHAQTLVEQAGGRLTLTTPNADQSVKVVVGPAPGVASVSGFPGIADGTTYSGLTGVTVNTGAGNDLVEFDVETFESFSVQANTAGGSSERKIKWKIRPGTGTVAANVDVTGAAAGSQVSLVEVDSEANSAAVTLRTGLGSEVAAKVQSSNPTESLRVVFDAPAPKSTLEVASSANALEVDVRGGTTIAANELKYTIAQSRPATVALNWSIATSALADVVEANVAAPGSTVTQRGSVVTRAGDDLAKFETEGFGTVTGLALNGGLGNDQLLQVVKGRFQGSQTLQTVMRGAEGDDQLTLTTDTGIFGTGLPNDRFPIVDCGAGFDQFNAFGQIIGCEARF